MQKCSEHKTYAGKRAPRSKCKTCWRIYFSTNIDERRNKYPKEFEEYSPKKRKAQPKTEKIKQPTVVNKINSKQKVEDYGKKLREGDPKKLCVDVPLLLGLRLWSQRLNTTVVINNYYSESDLVEFSMVITKLIPREHLYNLLLFHHVPKWAKESGKFREKPADENITIPVFNGNLAKVQEKFVKSLSALYSENRTSSEHKLFPWTLHDDLLVIENNQFILNDHYQPEEKDFKKTFEQTMNANTKKS